MRRPNAKPPEPSPSPSLTVTAMDSAAKLHLRSSSKFPRSSHKLRRAVLVTAAVLATLAASAYLIVRGTAARVTKFRVVIDAGSTGTRIHVLRYDVVKGEAVFDFKRGLSSLRVNPGLSSYAETPGGAGESLAELIEFGKGRVPRGSWARTEIRLMATAGMRLLDGKVQEEILESCREVMRGSGFMFNDGWASVISGSDEGKYAWVAANHALGSLGGDPLQTTGIIELGGASAQVTFVAREPVPSEFSHSLQYGNYSYNLYSHSFLHFGQNVAHDSLREALISGDLNSVNESTQMDPNTMIDPCTPKGHSHEPVLSSHAPGSVAVEKTPANSLRGAGDFSQCRSAALALLKKGNDKCSYQHCQIGSAFVPKLHGRFLATENFFFTSKFFRLSPKAKLSDLMRAGEQYCREDWSVLKKKYHPHDDEDLLRYCFSSAYIVALLNDGLGIALNDERISFTNQVRGAPLDWALGAFILQSSADLEENRTNLTSNIVRDDSPTLLALIVIFLFLLFMAWTVSKWKKPQLKTIYDLEKGRYIVTRVGK